MANVKEIDQEILDQDAQERRDFVVMAASGVACCGAAATAVPFVSSLAPSKDVLAVGSIEVDLSKVEPGKTMTVMWRGQPVFITHRTPEEIKMAEETPLTELKDPQLDADRVKKGKEQWLITIAVCTHLGCIPLAHKGDYGGWLCPCHGSHYDTSARIRKGPAPQNLAVPPYEFLSDTKIKIG